ncbi:MAG: 2,3-bisphosphoglycerate-independent phosphoglycerate mutase [Candidatus Promineifilaceae bacterium]|nr:2,3-bisphosphoglycerate-independent phosphoglycerate mutase [Candidatus Promineifilaceae bacterium]
MANLELIQRLAKESDSKIVLLVLDGVGGLPTAGHSQTALELAETPNLDRLASEGTLGLSHPIGQGITPGSGPAHLALFGYDAVSIDVGRGVLSALGIGFELQEGDVAARGNFCTLDDKGRVVDRRAGRISTEAALPLVEKLDQIQVDGVEIFVRHVKEYRILLALRGSGLSGALDDTDPQQTGITPLPVKALKSEAEQTAEFVETWLERAHQVLKDEAPANGVTLRGFGQDPNLPKFEQVYRLKAACVAVYPMYKGVSRLVGMDILETGKDFGPAEEFQVVADHWDDYDFFFVHIKPTDSRGEDGDIEAKADVIETVDAELGRLLDLHPDVLVVTGDHSTPARLKSHSWHPVPTLLWAPASHLRDTTMHFGEREAQRGGLGHFMANELMPLALAHALRLEKFGA